MALKSGFYNALEVNGIYDRVYSADEYTQFYAAFIKDGVRRSGDDDFKCTAAGLVITVAAGYAICGSKWVHNDAIYTLPEITPPVGDYSRIDGVFLHVDTTEATRAASIVYRTGTPASNPQPPAKDTTAGVFELCLCQVGVTPSATSVTINDTRGNSELCGWITTPVGADDFFQIYDEEMTQFIEQGEAAFNSWFENVRDTLASVTLFKQYTWYFKTTATQTTDVTFNIPQYDPTGVDIVNVYVNGMREIAGVDYTLSGSTITFINSKIVNTEILVVVYKSIDGTGLGSVSDEVTELQNEVAAMQDAYEFNYVCNGQTDNEGITALLNSKRDSLSQYGTIKVNIYGTFGATRYVYIQQTGTGDLFNFVSWGDKKIILDFANCSCWEIDLAAFNADTGRIIHCTSPIEILNLNAIVTNFYVFASAYTTRLYMRNCRVWLNYNKDSTNYAIFAQNGVFENCRISVTQGHCFFAGSQSKYIRVNGCECYAFKKSNVGGNVIWATHNVPVFTSQMICPTVSRAGYTQEYAIYDTYTSAAHASYSDTLTQLPISATGQNVRGTINLSVQVMAVDDFGA